MMEEELRTLPPGINGNQAGTLMITFRQCSVPNVVAHIKFWGDVGCNVCPSSSINFTLVGEISTIETYLRDASPLHIKILTKDSALMGHVFIPDLSLPTQDCKRSSKCVISIRETIIGDATFELHYRLMPAQTQQPNLQRVDDFEMSQLLEQANSSECQDSDLSGSIAQEKYSLISELLDICSDDMTIPTVDTSIVAATEVDPYDSWISNIISSAASPPKTSTQDDKTITACKQPIETAASAAAAAVAVAKTCPHPISLFLSNVATAANATQVRSSSTALAGARVERIPSTVVPPKLEPMQPPPIWIDIGVTNLRFSVIGIGSPPSSIELNLICNEPLISLCDLVQSSAFGDHETSKYSSENVKTVEMPNECKEFVSLPAQLSWQAGLKTLNGSTEITLQLRYHCNDEKVIAGHVSIPFQMQMLKSSDTLGLLPRFEANGWFDILDPNNCSSPSVGKIQLSLASGTLKQIRSLPKAHKCAAAIQRYWRKVRSIRCCTTVVGKRNEEPQSDENSLQNGGNSNSLQNEDEEDDGDDDDDDDTVNSDPPPPPDNSDDNSAKQIQAESSPDSLFEEWSQQSFLYVGANENEVLNANSVRAAENDVGLTVALDTSLVESTNVDTGIRMCEVMGEIGTERNAMFSTSPTMDNAAPDAAALQDPFHSSHDQLDSHHNSLPNEDESTSRRRQPIDPPEEYDAPSKMKRKMDQTTSFSVPDAKRHRITNNSNSPTERGVSSPPNLHAGAIDMSPIEEDGPDEDCRSLQSVMKSLADVEERLCQNDVSISVDAAVAVDERSDLTSHTTGSGKSPQLQSPLGKGCSTNTKTAVVETCEKGTSPLCVPSQCKDASTSPCEERGRFEMQDIEEEDVGSKDVRDNEIEEKVGTPKNDDRSTLQLDWSLNKMTRTRNNSTQDLFPTLSTSDRRERYGSLFNSQSLRLSHSSLLLSPTTTNGAPHLEGTRVDSSGYRRYLSWRRNSNYEGVSSSAPSFNLTFANSDRIEQIFSGDKEKKNG